MDNKLPRRRFLKRTAAATGTLLASKRVLLEEPLLADGGRAAAPSDQLKIGIIGIGMQGECGVRRYRLGRRETASVEFLSGC